MAAPENTNAPVRVNKWNAVAFWCYNVQTDVCAICRNGIHEPCIECQADRHSQMATQCTLAWGACNHQFHLHCINRWLKTRPTCPMDNKPWQFQKFE